MVEYSVGGRHLSVDRAERVLEAVIEMSELGARFLCLDAFEGTCELRMSSSYNEERR